MFNYFKFDNFALIFFYYVWLKSQFPCFQNPLIFMFLKAH